MNNLILLLLPGSVCVDFVINGLLQVNGVILVVLAGGHNVGADLDPGVDESGVILERRHVLPERGVLLQITVSPEESRHDAVGGALVPWHANALL